MILITGRYISYPGISLSSLFIGTYQRQIHSLIGKALCIAMMSILIQSRPSHVLAHYLFICSCTLIMQPTTLALTLTLTVFLYTSSYSVTIRCTLTMNRNIFVNATSELLGIFMTVLFIDTSGRTICLFTNFSLAGQYNLHQ